MTNGLILCLDAGNSRLKWGLCLPGETHPDGTTQWRATGVADYAALTTAGIAALPTLQAAPIAHMIACNVAGERATEVISLLSRHMALPLTWLQSSAAACGVTNSYDLPEQLGADRWAALIGARSIQPGRVLVVVAGTATTLDLLDETGHFLGGLILPGLALMRSSLGRHTAQLPDLSQAGFDRPFRIHAQNTDDAIFSGAICATLGAIERQLHLIGAGTICLLSGGAAPELASRLAHPCRLIDNLVLEGLARVAAAATGTTVEAAARS